MWCCWWQIITKWLRSSLYQNLHRSIQILWFLLGLPRSSLMSQENIQRCGDFISQMDTLREYTMWKSLRIFFFFCPLDSGNVNHTVVWGTKWCWITGLKQGTSRSCSIWKLITVIRTPSRKKNKLFLSNFWRPTYFLLD